jgi:hypothetical protein
MNQMFDTDSSVLTLLYYKSSCSPLQVYFFSQVSTKRSDASSEIITVLSANVFQENLEYAKFTALVHNTIQILF